MEEQQPGYLYNATHTRSHVKGTYTMYAGFVKRCRPERIPVA